MLFSDSMKTALIVNPVSGNGRSFKVLPKVAVWCHNQGLEFKLLTTTGPGEATRLARVARLDGHERIIALGGDGTVNEVAQALIGTEASLGVLPGGSGNDFLKMLSRDKSLESMIKVAFQGQANPIDVGLLNGRPFFNSVGVGFDAEVAARVQKSSMFSGFLRYIAAVFKVWINLRPYSLEIEIDQVKIAQSVTLVCIGNGRSSGGGFHLTPQAKLDDGLLDVCVIEALPRRKIFKYLPHAINGTHIRLEGVRIYRSRKIVLKSGQGFPVHLDGEIVSEPLEKLEITLDRRRLNVAMADGAQ